MADDYITWPLVITKNPETGKRNVGCIACRSTTSAPRACTGKRKNTAPNIFAARAPRIRNGRIEVAVAIGSDPATCLAGILPDSAGYGRDDVLRISAARAGGNGSRAKPSIWKSLPMPEIVLEGYVEIGEMRTEGPFGDHTGFYSLEGRVSRFST